MFKTSMLEVHSRTKLPYLKGAHSNLLENEKAFIYSPFVHTFKKVEMLLPTCKKSF